MRVLGLPGRKPSTLVQMRSLLEALGFAGAPVQIYGFWRAGEAPDPDIGPEARRAALASAELVVAKSIGVRVALAACATHGLKPRGCLFLATPLAYLAHHGRTAELARHAAAVPTLFVQQADDPNGARGEPPRPWPCRGTTTSTRTSIRSRRRRRPGWRRVAWPDA